jgi:TorA maturation chaperone TorD
MSDLAALAERRAGVAAACGWLLLAEPGDELDELVKAVPDLAALADPSAAVDYERVLLRGVPPYESVFVSDEGERGGPTVAEVVGDFADVGFTEHETGRWRVAGPDHLGLHLRCYAHLVAAEAAAWAGDDPDEAVACVERERRFVARRLAPWAPVALDALASVAMGSPYAALVDVVGQYLVDEVDRLRPAPLLGGPPPAVTDAPSAHVGSAPRIGPGSLARRLLAPARSGFWLDASVIDSAARMLGFPYRPLDGRRVVRRLLEAADEAGELGALVEPWIEVASRHAARHAARARREPGMAAIWCDWAARAETTIHLLAAVRDAGRLGRGPETTVMLRVSGGDPTAARDLLERAGFGVEIVEG